MRTITVRNVDCAPDGKLIRRAIHRAYTPLNQRDPTPVSSYADKYLREHYGKGLYQTGSASGVDVDYDGTRRQYVSVPRQDAPMFHSVRFEMILPATDESRLRGRTYEIRDRAHAMTYRDAESIAREELESV